MAAGGVGLGPAPAALMDGMLGALGQPVFATDAEGWLTAYNPAAADLWGWSPPLGTTRWGGAEALLGADGGALSPGQYPVARALSENRRIVGEDIFIRRRDGRRVALQAHVSPIHGADGRPQGAVVLLLDLTRQHEAEARARAAALAKTRFLSAMSHELRTPIHGILGMAELLADVAAQGRPLGDEEAGWVEDIHGAGRHLLSLVDDAIAFAQASVAAARPHHARQATLLGKTVSDVASTVQPAFAARGVGLVLRGAPEPTAAALDPPAARQALLGVLREVLRHMPEGQAVALAWGKDPAGGLAFVEVTCPGLTLPADLLVELDRPFAGADRDTYARGLEGAGLSVAAAGELLRGHAGQLLIGGGRDGAPPCFRLAMPLAEAPAAPPPAPAATLPPALHHPAFSLEQVLAATQDIILVTVADLDAPGPTIIYANRAFTELTGYPPEEALGRSPRFLQGPATDQGVLRRLSEDMRAGREARATVLNYTRDGTPYWIEMHIVPLRDRRGAISHFAAVERVVSWAM